MSKEAARKPETGRDFSFESLYEMLTTKGFTGNNPASARNVADALVNSKKFTVRPNRYMDDEHPFAIGTSLFGSDTQVDIFSQGRARRARVANIAINSVRLLPLPPDGKLRPEDAARWRLGVILGLAGQETGDGTVIATGKNLRQRVFSGIRGALRI